MTGKSYRSIEAWRTDMSREKERERVKAARQIAQRQGPEDQRPSEAAPAPRALGDALCVRAEMTPDADAAAVEECRAAVLDWMQEAVGEALPRRARRHQPFSHRGESAVCEAVRNTEGGADHWAAQVIERPGPDQESVTEIVIAHPAGETPSIFARVQDRSVVPRDMAAHYPSAALAAMSDRTTLLQDGKRMGSRAIEVDSEHRMKVFLEMLLDPGRALPFVVMSVSPDFDRESQEKEWAQAARALTGLAVAWVLPTPMTYRLSDTVGKPLSVFLGAWRFYRPGFNHNSFKERHPLVLRRHMHVPDTIRRFVRMAADERAGPVPEDWLGFDEVRPKAPPPAAHVEAGPAAGPPQRRGFVGKLKAIWGVLTSRGHRGYAAGTAAQVQEQPAPAAPAEAPSPPASAVPATSAPQPAPAAATAAPADAPAPDAPAAAPPAPAAPGVSSGTEAVSEPLAAQYGRASRAAAPAVRRKPRGRGLVPVGRDRYEKVKERLKETEAERDEAVKRAMRLEGLVHILGGDVDAPFPTEWDEFADWCDQSLGSGIVVAPSARRELRGAEFADVGLAARCLHWLAGDYCRARRRGNNPHLHGAVRGIGGVLNQPCGGDTFEFKLQNRSLTADWHLKNGGNTRDPKRCLRIYYAWDDQTRQVVVASMPGHRRSGLT